MSIGNDRKKKHLKNNPLTSLSKDFSSHARDRANDRLISSYVSISTRILKKKLRNGQATKRNAPGRRLEIVFEQDFRRFTVITNRKMTDIITIWDNPIN